MALHPKKRMSSHKSSHNSSTKMKVREVKMNKNKIKTTIVKKY